MTTAATTPKEHRLSRAQLEQLHATRAYLAALVDSSDDAIIGKALDGTIVSWNHGAERLYGYEASEVIGRPITMLVPPERANELPPLLDRLQRGERVEHHETVRLRKDGTRVDVSITMSSIKDAHGAMTGTSIIARDITQMQLTQKRLEQLNATRAQTQQALLSALEDLREAKINLEQKTRELEHARAALELLNEQLELRVEERTQELTATHEQLLKQEQLAAVGRLAAGISHDLRTPLATLTNVTYLLQSKLGASDPELAEYLALMARGVKHMQGIVSDVLEFTQPRPPVWAPVQMNDLLAEVLLIAQPAIDAAAARVEARFDPALPTIKGDAGQLLRVFTNLITNAAQAMTDGGTLTLQTLGRGHAIDVLVQDTGPGLDADAQAKLFTPFFTTKTKGIGLGLVVVKHIVDAHHGGMTLDSTPGQGATFTVMLPVHQACLPRDGGRQGGE